MGNYISTFSGKKVDIQQIGMDDISLADIAHALSNICRGGGHYSRFYSVAQHCLNCFAYAEKEKMSMDMQLFMLLHDASEAYLYDLCRPIKKLMPQYIEIEGKISNAVYQKYMGRQMCEEEKKMIEMIDDEILRIEKSLYFQNEYRKIEWGDWDLIYPDVIERRYFEKCNRLIFDLSENQ